MFNKREKMKKHEKKAFYRVKKSFRNSCDVYYIKVYPSELNEYMLERIGEHTSGGNNYGYSIKTRKIKKLPKGAKLLGRVASYTIY